MGKKNDMSIEEALKIKKLLVQGASIHDIVKICHRCTKTVTRVRDAKIKVDSYHRNHRGAKIVLTERVCRKVLHKIDRNPYLSVRHIANEMGFKISKSSVHNILIQNQCIRRKIRKKPPLNQYYKISRINFAEKHLIQGTNFDKIFFSDKKKWNMDGPDGFQDFLWLKKDESD